MPRPKVNFFLKAAQGDRNIFMRISHHGVRRFFFTYYTIDPKLWDKKRQRVNAKFARAREINNFLDTWDAQMNGIITHFILSNKFFDVDTIKAEFEKKYRSNLKKTSDWHHQEEQFDEWLKRLGRARQTRKNHSTSIKMLLEFMDKKELTAANLDNYVDWLFEQRYEDSYIEKRVHTVQMFLRFLKENEFNVPEWKLRRKLRIIEKPAIALRFEEYKRLVAHRTGPSLQKVKDMFIIGCWSSLRISDARLREGDIKDGKIVRLMKKTSSIVEIPVMNDLEEVIERYKSEGKPLPYMNHKDYNIRLKSLFREAGLDRKVKIFPIDQETGERIEVIKELWEVASSKMGRKSLVSWFEDWGLPGAFINLFTGHRADKERRPYTDVDVQKIFKEIKKRVG